VRRSILANGADIGVGLGPVGGRLRAAGVLTGALGPIAQRPVSVLAWPAAAARRGIPKFPTRFDRRSDHFLCGTGISDRFDNFGEQGGTSSAMPHVAQGCSKPRRLRRMIPFPLLHGHVMHPRASRRTTVQESKADFRAAYRAAPEADPARSALFDVLFAETVEAAAKAPADAAARYTADRGFCSTCSAIAPARRCGCCETRQWMI